METKKCPYCGKTILAIAKTCKHCQRSVVVDTYPATETVEDRTVEPNENITVDVIINDAGRDKLGIVKLVKELRGLSLKEAKELVDDVPQLLVTNVPIDEAKIIRSQFEQQGAEIELIQSGSAILSIYDTANGGREASANNSVEYADRNNDTAPTETRINSSTSNNGNRSKALVPIIVGILVVAGAGLYFVKHFQQEPQQPIRQESQQPIRQEPQQPIQQEQIQQEQIQIIQQEQIQVEQVPIEQIQQKPQQQIQQESQQQTQPQQPVREQYQPLPEPTDATITGTYVIFREDHSTSSRKLDNFENGEQIVVLGYYITSNNDKWYKLKRKNGATGWVYSQYAKLK
jgi:ribosomal protein L7/L12